MLVDGVNVEEIVLHLADDGAEIRQVAAEDAVLVHAPKFVHQAARLLEYLQEQRAVFGAVPECVVDQVACPVGRAACVRSCP